MRCIVVDDEPLAIKWLEKLIADIDSIQLVASFGNALQANEFLKSNLIDLLFLDIEMASINGLDFMKSLVHPPLVIFVTAYPQYALESYELNTIDYLLKPVRMERLLKSVNKAAGYVELLKYADEKDMTARIERDHIFVRADKRFVKLFFNEILYIEGLKDYVVIKTSEKNKVITAMNIKTIYEQLPKTIFARVSKSHIVNTNQIKSTDFHHVYLQDEELPIGNSYRDEFYDIFVNGKVVKR
jgi:two-component system, LytTR family, response regulator